MVGKKTQNTALAPRAEAGMTRWTLWNEMTDIRRQMDDLFSRAFGYTPLSQLLPGNGFNFEPPVDIYTTEDKVFVCAALPGFTADAIDVEATPDTIIIQGERKALYDGEKTTSEQQSGYFGESQFCIQCTLPAEIDPHKVKSNFHDGILELEMTMTEKEKNKGVKVAVKAA